MKSFFKRNADEQPRFLVQWEDTTSAGNRVFKSAALDSERDAKMFARVVGGFYSGIVDKPVNTFGREVR